MGFPAGRGNRLAGAGRPGGGPRVPPPCSLEAPPPGWGQPVATPPLPIPASWLHHPPSLPRKAPGGGREGPRKEVYMGGEGRAGDTHQVPGLSVPCDHSLHVTLTDGQSKDQSNQGPPPRHPSQCPHLCPGSHMWAPVPRMDQRHRVCAMPPGCHPARARPWHACYGDSLQVGPQRGWRGATRCSFSITLYGDQQVLPARGHLPLSLHQARF